MALWYRPIGSPTSRKEGRQLGSIPSIAERAAGNREPGIQRLQVLSRAGTYSCHHHSNSLLLCWLLTLLALVIGRLYRLRYLHRGTHKIISACDLVRLLWIDLGGPLPCASG